MSGRAYGDDLRHVTFTDYDICRKVIIHTAGLVPRPHVTLGDKNDLTLAAGVLAELAARHVFSEEDVVNIDIVNQSNIAFQDRSNPTPVRPRTRPHRDDPKRVRETVDGLLSDLGLK